jgi:phosphatidylglycerol phospholipase C
MQASAVYPENTLASFEAAIRDGAEGIESGISCRSYTVPIP